MMSERVTREIDGALRLVGLKQCARCHNIKGLEEFHRHRRQADGLQPYCKVCNLTQNKEAFEGGRDPNKPWPEKQISYQAAHHRVKLVRGSASKHLCVDTGLPAEDWSYNGEDPHELIVQEGKLKGMRYSTNQLYYEPRTRKAHKAHDKALRMKVMHR